LGEEIKIDMGIPNPHVMSADKRQPAGPEAGRGVSWTNTLAALSDPSLEPLFWRADRLGSPSGWWEHVPFAHWVVCATAPRVLVELGTHTGVSYAAFCQAVSRAGLATRCHAVDTWQGDPHAGFYGPEILDELRRFHDERFGAFSTLLQFTFDEARDHIEDGSIDLLHIDGLHTYQAVQHDFETWLPKLSDRAVVLFHDINVRSGDFGVWRLWAELRQQYPAFEFVHGYGLGVLAVGRDTPAPVAALCELTDPVAIAMIRTRFARLGEHWSADTRERLLFQEIGQRIWETEQLRVELTRRSTEADSVRRAAERNAEQLSNRASEAEQALARLDQRAEAEANAASAQAAELERVLAAARAEQTRLRLELDEVLRSTFWRITGPARKAASVLPPGLRRQGGRAARLAYWVLTPHRTRERIAYFRSRSEAPVTAAPNAEPDTPAAAPEATLTHDELIKGRFSYLEPLRTFAAPHDGPRVTIVTDSINSGSLYGGVATGIILAALLARRLDASLRLVTRTEVPVMDNFGMILRTHGVPWTGNVEWLYSPPGPAGRDVPITRADLFLTTSWWTTRATRAAVPPAQIVYMLGEDERMFYPMGDEHLLCGETLSDPSLSYVVNSNLLLRHLQSEGLAPNGIAFEPAFPDAIYYPERSAERNGKRSFFFYARPNNLRNLYWRGVTAVATALEEGVFDPERWDFYFVGRDAPELVLPRGVRPHVLRNLPWTEYGALVRRIDVGLSLMYTPHPSYPPLDLAASGAVVVTNRFGSKIDMSCYSPNILCVEPTVPGLVAGLHRAVALAKDPSACAANAGQLGMPRDWPTALAPVLDYVAERRSKG
jgi:hypothetical protein